MGHQSSVDVVGVGLNATDTLIQLESFPRSGDKVAYRGEVVQLGGQVASAMVACQSWGLRTRYVGKLGDDDAARLHTHAFAQAGVDARLVRVAEASSPRSLIFVDRLGERTVLNRREDRLTLLPQDLQQDWVVGCQVLLVDGHDTAAATLAACWAREAGIPVVADLDEVYPGLEHLLAYVDHLVVSKTFPERLTGLVTLEEALPLMHQRYGCRLTAATLGEDGVLAWDGAHFHAASAYKVPVVDTTGAGDIFHAAYVYGLLQSWPVDKQLEFACAAAALNCTAQGARGGIHSITAIEALVANGVKHHRSRSVDPGR